MRFFALVTLLGLAIFPALTQTTTPKKNGPAKTVKKPATGKTTSAAKPKPTLKKTTGSQTAGKPKPKTTSALVKHTSSSPSTAVSKPKPAVGKTAPTHASSTAKPKAAVPSAKKPDEKAEWDMASSVADTAGRVEALQKFNLTFPKSDRRKDALELISATRGQMANEKMVAGDAAGAADLFKLAALEAPKPMSDALFTESLVKAPVNLFFRGERDAAFEIAKTLEEKADANVSQLLAIANFYMSVENGTEAKRVAGNAITLNAESSAAWQTLGLAHRMDFQLDEAATDYAKALAIEPDSLTARRGLAEMKRSLGKADEAVTLYREILAKDSENVPAQTGLILALFDSEKKADAEAELTKSIQGNPGNVILLAGVAYWYAAHNDGDKAIDYAQKSIAVDPRLIWSHIALARGLLVQKKPVEAEKVLQASRQYGEFPTLEYEIASARLAAGFYRDAAEVLAKNFSVKNGVVSTKLGGRVTRESKSFIELVGPERRASIFAPTAADDPENAARLAALLELTQQLNAPDPKPDAVVAAADAFIRGDDRMKVHRQIFAATQMLERKVALPKVIEIAKSTVTGVDTGLETPSATAAVLASELYEPRAIAFARGEFLAVPDVSRSTLSSILRGRIEEINGWALYEMDAPADSVLRLRRAVSVLPADSAWWRSSMWRLGSALALTGKDAEALDAYIKCYKSGTPDAGRYAVIESLFKRLNGSTDGLEIKIGAKPAPTAVIAQRPERGSPSDLKTEPPTETKMEPPVSPTAEVKIESPKPDASTADSVSRNVTPKSTPEIRPETAAPVDRLPIATASPEVKADIPKSEVKPLPEQKNDLAVQTKTDPVASTTPEIKVETLKTEPTPEAAQMVVPKPIPETKIETSAEIKLAPVATATPEAKIDTAKMEPTPSSIDTSKLVAEKTSDPSNPALVKPKDSDSKPASGRKELFPPVVITVPTPNAGKNPANDPAEKADSSAFKADIKSQAEPKTDVQTPEKKPETAPVTGDSRPRVVGGKQSAGTKPCSITSTDESLSLKSGESDVAVIMRGDGDGDGGLDGLTATSNSPKNISVQRETIEGMTGRAVFVVKSISTITGLYQIKFEMPCGKKDMFVKVR